MGTGAAPLWTAKCTYLTEIAGYYSLLSHETNEIVVNRFFGIFFSMFQFSQILGNFISSVVLKPPDDLNSSLNSTLFNLELCGSNDCPQVDGDNNKPAAVKIVRPQLSTVYSLCFIYLSLAVASILLIAFCLNDFKNKSSKRKQQNSQSINENRFTLLISTVKQLTNLNQLLIIPLTLWLGFSLAVNTILEYFCFGAFIFMNWAKV